MTTRKRKTPPISPQVIEPYKKRNSRFGKRLIDFDTGSDQLEEQHEKWLLETMLIAKASSEICIVVVGFASRLGDPEKNRALSLRRANSVINFMRRHDDRVLLNHQIFWCGEDVSGGEENAPEWRAVEVHVYMESCEGAGFRDPPPPTWKKTPPRILPPLPGGTRFKEWSVANPGGGQATILGVSGGFNIFFIRNDITKEERGYINPVGGVAVGFGFKLKGMPDLAKLIFKTLLGSITFSSLSYTSVVRPSAELIKPLRYPVTWGEMEACFVEVFGGGAGLVVSRITFTSPRVYHYGPSGVPINPQMELFTFESTGWNIQASIGGVGGPLWRIPG